MLKPAIALLLLCPFFAQAQDQPSDPNSPSTQQEVSGDEDASSPPQASDVSPSADDNKPSLPDIKISDTLVQDLSCNEMKQDTILQHLQPDAFSKDRELSLRNWGTPDGLGQCWSLAHAQRLVFFMGRFGAADDSITTSQLLDMMAGKNDKAPFTFSTESALKLTEQLSYPNTSEDRNLMSEIHGYQRKRFFNPKNVKMITGNRDRKKSSNAKLFVQLQDNLKKGWLSMVVLRAGIALQHVVLVKNIKDGANPNEHILTVYDSNYPRQENTLVYREDEQEFYAESVFRDMLYPEDAAKPVGVFSVDDNEMPKIEASLYKHYKDQCAKLQAPASSGDPIVSATPADLHASATPQAK